MKRRIWTRHVFQFNSQKCVNTSASFEDLHVQLQEVQLLSPHYFFSAVILGLEGAEKAASPPRVRGASIDMFLDKKPSRQAPALHPAMIGILEVAACCGANPYLRTMAGYCLPCLFGRLRTSDAGRLLHASLVANFFKGL